MHMNNIVLTFLILLMLTYAIYEELIVNLLNGKTKLKIKLNRKNRIDAVIFIILIAIVIYHNIIQHGSQITNYLLMISIIIAVYLTFIRYPKLYFKDKVFYYNNVYILYENIKTINLSKNGILIVGLEKRKIYIAVKQFDDLDEIYNFMINNK
ncbi:DUF986 family protein [Arsenophonus endosymbiont of Bemisia tabaci]|uniref:DUF986 family protein n=1 Tax=Arsenophonus endosymbiont of Bemisia tabaci TaxID=536059 RepID=UPI0015F45098|nr:DUF986 family protein [Arsenophonus endosymbiont of Bemisia tabaci]CAA2930092.1 hypothetical protein ARSQ2_01208 [Arsenophonus endosymbiont of Bemisia tabaci Q2]